MAAIKTPRKKTTATPSKAEIEPKEQVAPVKQPRSKKPAPATLEPAAEVKAPLKARRPAKAPAADLATPPVPQSPQASGPAADSGATLPPLVQVLYTAIRESRPVEFIFADGDANAPRTFEPRRLLFDALSQAWYVWGWDRRYNAERHHRVDLLTEVNAVDGVGRAAQGPYPEGTPANQIGGWLGGEAIPVKLTLQKQWVFAVKQAPPAFPAFTIEDQAEGLALVSFTATDLRAIARWVMQFGDGVQVLEPARLVDRVKQVGASWAGRERLAPLPAAPRPLPRAEATPEHRRPESKPTQEPRPHREARPERELRPERDETSRTKPSKIEVIRFDRL